MGTSEPSLRWARSFGTDAERYDRARPRYPDAMVDRIVAAAPGRDFLDVGCGTGIAARQFQARGARVLGVDIDARMAEPARASGVEVEVARFEDWDPAGRAFDAVLAGQTWHWVDPVAGAAKAAQALRPGGRLALFWNLGQPQPGVTAAFSEVHRRLLPPPLAGMWERPALDAYSAVLDRTVDGIRATGAFGEPEQWRFGWERPYTRDDWLDQVPTHGGHSELAPERREELLAGLGAAIDAAGGSFVMHYTTVVITSAKAPPGSA